MLHKEGGFDMKGGSSSKAKAGSKNSDRLFMKQNKGKKIKDPNKPKRPPPSPFFVFMEGFRKQFKEKNPTVKGVAAMGKAGGDKWRSMSDEDKAEFVTIAEQRKKDYEEKIRPYDKKMQAGGNEEEQSDKSKSEVNNENGDPLSVMCHQCQKNDKGQVVICGNCKWKRCLNRCYSVPTLRTEASFHSFKSCNSSSKVAGQSLESDTKSVPSTSDKVVKDRRRGSSAMEDVPSEKGGKEVVPNTASSGQPVYTPSTSHDSPNISHQTPLSIPTETVGFFKQLADMLQGNKSDWVLPPQIQLDEQTIREYEQLLKKGLSGDLRDLYKDSTYREFNEALIALLACRRIPSKLHQGFLSLHRDLPSLASRVFELNKEINIGMLQRVNRSTMKELESSLHKYRKCEEHILKLEQEKEYNVSEMGRLKVRNQVIDSKIATDTAEADALQKASAAQSLKIANLDVAGALNESTLQRSLDDLTIMENEWRKRVDMLDF